MAGWWQELGAMMTFVFEGLRYILVESFPSGLRVRWTSRKAIELPSSASRVNLTRGCTLLRQSLKDSAGSM